MAKVTTLSRGPDSGGSPNTTTQTTTTPEQSRAEQSRAEQARPDGGGDANAPATFFSLVLYH
ncbi:hypothetical protein E2C01_084899 [Portunus trituberculatus]|uniref:Uncharacterized protein n=1 Tax=Portunus trituberculatus TaxID=210409 RepID=A0A5B7J581_PORTR|nr:hypothetical protein [Portunus trituberculatus]